MWLVSSVERCLDHGCEYQALSDPVDEGGGPANDPAEDPAVDSLTDDFGISTSEAVGQMKAQTGAGLAVQDLPPGLARVYSGIEMDHEHGGRVVVHVSVGRSSPGKVTVEFVDG